MDAAGSLAGPGKRQRRGPPGLTLLARSREMGELKAGGLVFAAWVERHNTLAPEVVYCCSTQLGAVAKASVQAVLRQLASEHLLDSHCRGLTLSHISVVELSRYELAGGGAKPPPEELPPEAPADPRRSFKYRLKRLVDAAEQCSDGPFVAYVLSTGHKTAVKQLAGGDLARAVYCSELWAAVFEVEMGIAPTPWQDDAVRADLPPGTLGWYAAFMAFGQGAYLLHPTAGSWLLPDAMADAAGGADSGTLVWRIKDAPVHVQVEERPLQPARVTCDCSSFRAVGAAVGRCLHTVYISSLEPPPPGPPPPVLIPAARCPRVDDVSAQPGDYIWLPDRMFVACVARSGQLRCCHSGCRGACQHVLEVQAAFGPHLPTPAASHSRSQQSDQQTGSEAASAGLAAVAAGGGGAAGAASASIRDGARRAVVVEEEEEPAGDALPLPPAVRYPYPCDATTAVTMAGWEKAVLLSSPGLGNGGGAGGAGGGSGSGGSSGQQGCALSSGALLDLVPLLPTGGGQCACGSTYAPRRVCPAIVYGPQHLGPIDAQLHELRSGCGKASCVLAYDGVHDGLFRYSSRSFFSLRHMYTDADQLIGSGMNVEAYAKSQQRLVATTLPPDAQRPQQFTAGLFRRSWQQFEAQLDRCHTFSCPSCRRKPHVLVGDATAITMSVDLYMGTPVTDRIVLPPSDMGKRAHKRADRCWCPEEKGRAALRGYSSALRGDGKDVYGQKVAGWAGVGDSAKQHDSPAAVGAMEASLPAADQSSGLTAGFLRVASNATHQWRGRSPRIAGTPGPCAIG